MGQRPVLDPSVDADEVTWPRDVLVVLGLVAALFAVANLTALEDGDTYWRLASGELTLDHGALVRHDPFSWTAAGESWFSSGWASDVVLALVDRVAGGVGLSVLAAVAMGCFVVAVAVLARRIGAGAWACVGGATVAGLVARPFMVARPQALVLVLFPLGVVAADRALERSKVALVAVAAIFVCWANLHASFPLGLAVLALWSAGWALRRRSTEAWKSAALVVVVAVAASFANPLGPRSLTRVFDTRAVSSEIVEWQPLSLDDPGELALALVLVVALTSFVVSGYRRRPELFAPLVLLSVLSFDAIRNAPFAATLAGAQLACAAAALELAALRDRARARRVLLVRATVLGLVASIGFVALTREGIGEPDPNEFPVELVRAVPQGCALLNEYSHGGFLIHERWPDLRVSQDGRNDLYGQDRLDEQRSILASTSVERVTDLGATCVLLRPDRPLTEALRADTAWHEVGSDPQAVLFVSATLDVPPSSTS